MNSVLPAVRGRVQLHSPPAVRAPERAAPQVGMLDRLAMRLGLALLMWGRRRAVLDRHHARSVRHEREHDRAARQRDAERAFWTLVPPR